MVWRSVVINQPARLKREHFSLVIEQEQTVRHTLAMLVEWLETDQQIAA